MAKRVREGARRCRDGSPVTTEVSAWLAATKRMEKGDWQQFRCLPGLVEIDLHHGQREPALDYHDAMGQVYEDAFNAIKKAHAEGRRYLLIRHGWSTSRPGQTTARSQVRQLMRSPTVTPFVNRAHCVQHYSCFLVALRSKRRAV
jgi:hypothetical protein